jgi:hypothetical protein
MTPDNTDPVIPGWLPTSFGRFGGGHGRLAASDLSLDPDRLTAAGAAIGGGQGAALILRSGQ